MMDFIEKNLFSKIIGTVAKDGKQSSVLYVAIKPRYLSISIASIALALIFFLFKSNTPKDLIDVFYAFFILFSFAWMFYFLRLIVFKRNKTTQATFHRSQKQIEINDQLKIFFWEKIHLPNRFLIVQVSYYELRNFLRPFFINDKTQFMRIYILELPKIRNRYVSESFIPAKYNDVFKSEKLMNDETAKILLQTQNKAVLSVIVKLLELIFDKEVLNINITKHISFTSNGGYSGASPT